MTSPAIPSLAPSDSTLGDVQVRISQLDARIRAIDPSWIGLGGDLAGIPGAGGSSDPGSFAAALGSAGTGSAAASLAALGMPQGTADPALAMVQPVQGATISQPYGPTSLALEPPATVDGVSYAHFHDGLDLAAPLGTPVRATADGTVISAGPTADGAVVVRIRHADGSETRYGHLDPSLEIKAGDRVQAGQEIGKVGLTGNTTGPHVHFELWSNGRAIDPAPSLAGGRLPGAATAATASLAAASPGAGTAAASGLLSSASLAQFDAVSSNIPYAGLIRSSAVAAGVDPLLLASLVGAESGFRPNAISSAGAEGLTQLMPATARSLGVSEPLDAAQNLAGGARYLASDLRMYGRTDVALAAYQAGKGAVAAAGGVPDYPSTRSYISTILGSWTRYLGGNR